MRRFFAAAFCIMMLFCAAAPAAVQIKSSAGGEPVYGDGSEGTAYSSTAYLTYDGVPIKADASNMFCVIIVIAVIVISILCIV